MLILLLCGFVMYLTTLPYIFDKISVNVINQHPV